MKLPASIEENLWGGGNYVESARQIRVTTILVARADVKRDLSLARNIT